MEQELPERGLTEPIGNVAVHYLIHESDAPARSTIRTWLTRCLQHAYPQVYDEWELQDIRDACAVYESDYGVTPLPKVFVTLVGNYNTETRALTDAFVRTQGTPQLDPALSDEGYLPATEWMDYNTRVQGAYRYLCGYATGRFRKWYDPDAFRADGE